MLFKPTAIQAEPNYNTAFTRGLLHALTATARAKPHETEAEYKERYTAIATAFASFAPRDPLEQMLAAQFVAAHHAALDCLAQAMAAEDAPAHDRLHRVHAGLNRAMNTTMRLLTKAQARPAESLRPPPVIEAPAQPEPIIALNPMQEPIRREKPGAAAGPAFKVTRDPAKMTDAELESAIAAAKAEEARMNRTGARERMIA